MKNSIVALAIIGSIAAAGSAFAMSSEDAGTKNERLPNYNNESTQFSQTSGFQVGAFAGQPSWRSFTNGNDEVRQLYIRQADGSLKLHSSTIISTDR